MIDFEILGWIGFGFISLGYYLNSQKNILCFYLWAIGNIIFIIYAYQIESNGNRYSDNILIGLPALPPKNFLS